MKHARPDYDNIQEIVTNGTVRKIPAAHQRFRRGERVTYVPYHAHGDLGHPDCEHGEVSSENGTYVFVQFVRNGILQSTSQACKTDQLVKW